MRITRNMAILRASNELTLVNPIRLEAAEERRLRGMGEVKRLLDEAIVASPDNDPAP